VAGLKRPLIRFLQGNQGSVVYQTLLPCQISAYCLMVDHLHYLISPAWKVVPSFNAPIGSKVSPPFSLGVGWQDKLWQLHSYDHLICSDDDWKTLDESILRTW
jgi:REP element-mobilizing transposase RayT